MKAQSTLRLHESEQTPAEAVIALVILDGLNATKMFTSSVFQRAIDQCKALRGSQSEISRSSRSSLLNDHK
jgi:hypothetical protein